MPNWKLVRPLRRNGLDISAVCEDGSTIYLTQHGRDWVVELAVSASVTTQNYGNSYEKAMDAFFGLLEGGYSNYRES
jgi:hypothetical protein